MSTFQVQYGQYCVSPASYMLNLGCGQPSPDYLDSSNALYSEVQTVKLPTNLLQYGVQGGHTHFKNMVINMHKHFTNDESIDESNIYMTNGISQSMLMLASLFRSESNIAFTEDPTYFLMLGVFKNLGYDVVPFNLDELDYEQALIAQLNNIKFFTQNNPIEVLEKENRKILMYIIPFHQNPTGKNISPDQISRLIRLCLKYTNIIILIYTFN